MTDMSMKKILLLLLPFLLLAIVFAFYFTKPSEPNVQIADVSVFPNIEPKDAMTYLGGKPVDIVFFFQGVANDILLPCPYAGLNLGSKEKIYRDDLIFFSFSYHPVMHWSSPQAVSETIRRMNNIVNVFNVRKVKIVGISMGGALALNILSKANKELKDKITDALIVYPVIDYEYTLFHTKRANIRTNLFTHFFSYKNPFKLMKESSPITCYDSISQNTKITLLEGVFDTHVCSVRIENYFNKIKPINKNVKLLKWNVDHLLVDVGEDYKKLVFSILN